MKHNNNNKMIACCKSGYKLMKAIKFQKESSFIGQKFGNNDSKLHRNRKLFLWIVFFLWISNSKNYFNITFMEFNNGLLRIFN